MKVSDVFLPIVEGPEDQLMSRFSRILKFDPRKTKYYQATKKIITPRFLNELIIPQDIFSVLAKLKLSDNQDEKVFRFILAASIFNGIFIGLPGTVGWGVIVSQIIEFIMATQIAYMVGLVPTLSNISVKKITDTITAAGIAGFTVLIVFEQVLKIIFNLAANIVPVGFATASAEIVTTLFYGLFIYLAFLEIKNLRNGQKLSLSGIGRIGANAATYTKSISVSLFNLVYTDAPRLFSQIKENVLDAWNGVIDKVPRMQGDLFLAGCFSFLLEGKTRELSGPFSSLWLDAWRKAFPVQLSEHASIEEISALAQSYDTEAIARIRQNVESKFYEILETKYENTDGDEWAAELIGGQNHPVSDALFVNSETGRAIEINYKFSENTSYIETHIANHPGVQVIAPPEISEKMNSPYVTAGKFDHATVHEINEENFESVLGRTGTGGVDAAAATGAFDFVARSAPFCSAYWRGNITRDQFKKVILQIFPETSARLVNRVAMLTLLGPAYGMFLLAGTGFKGALHETSDIPLNKEREVDDKVEPRPEDRKRNNTYSRRDLITLSFLKEFD